jgi:uroporphyrinogen decarboxylase
MAYQGVLDDLHRAIRMERPVRMPVLMCSEEADVRLAGSRYDLYNSDAREMVRVQREAIDRFDYDWVWLQVDDCMEFEPLGVKVQGGGDILPATCGYLPLTEDSLKQLKAHGYRVAGRMKVLLDAITELKSHFGDTVCVTGRTAAPFSSVTLAFGIQETMLALYDRPDLVREALRFFTEYQSRFGLDQIKAGADAIWLGDCNASGHLISPSVYREFAFKSASVVAKAYRAAGGFVHCHNSEEQPAMLEVLADVGFSIINCGPGINLTVARKAVGNRCCLSGNVNPILTLMNGTPEAVRAEVRNILATVSVHGGHVMCSGEMVPRATPEANIRAFVEETRTWKG